MKCNSKFTLTIGLMALLCLFSSNLQAQSVRSKININRAWKFFLGDTTQAEKATFSDKSWKNINLPHNFSLPYFQEARWYVGFGWYRKTITVPASWKNKNIALEFEGAFREAEIFVNGTLVGTHASGYTGFAVDITKALKVGDNTLAVRLSNHWSPRIAPRNGDHNFTGGIYRDVSLIVTNPTHVAWYGTFVKTPKVSAKEGLVSVSTEVENKSNSSKKIELRTSVFDPTGKVVDTFSSTQTIAANTLATFEQTGNSISQPKLWHPEHPFMYKLVSKLYENGKILLDQYETPFGFRWVEWTADKGFFLNDEHYYFKGANVHQDHAGWSSAVTNTGFYRDVQLIKDAGFDFIRGSHYPHDPAFADACDKLGMLFWSENNFWGVGGATGEGGWFQGPGTYPYYDEDSKPFGESLKTSLREMIRVNRNHPSIITWSMCNEPFFTHQSTMPKVRELLKELVAYSHELDPTRAAAIGGSQRGEIDKLGDIAGYNGDGARLFIKPGVASVVSEYGSVIDFRPGKYDAGWGDMESQPQFEWRSGQAIWSGFDYGTHAGQLGQMGIIDYQRIPKNKWYWYRKSYRGIEPPSPTVAGTPVQLKLSADKTVIQQADGTDDVHLLVTVLDAQGRELSSSPDVTLTLVSGPGEFPGGSSISFSNKSNIAIRDGKAAIEFRSHYAGTSVIKASSAGLPDAFITIISKNAPVYLASKTPKIAERPYVKFDDIMPAERKGKVNLVFNRPTRVSSEEASHTGRYVNDGSLQTYWQAQGNNKVAWLQIDLENTYHLTEIKLAFPQDGLVDYSIEISNDGINWITLSTQHTQVSKETLLTHTFKEKVKAGLVRIAFSTPNSNSIIGLSEFEVYGE
ncbi:glycoside hydrolase family 2 protein [Arcicella lustrica]|uniref:Glycoside hydrolase family 2 TIM barrel-domain containing protein n=1 Tax=Arcicella lustrica TaxID=2984196 RepID=A0ABU5SQ88_9BACT|nr:glycoside hydrolase family 2 TIM barrel-domain containing protein [Arcicella sp. DC25W]MEA5429404.1 glycoside hydrolase family 2 TIM barrel-domain containing protein [Arcicella sp. DC25W]